MHIQVGDHNGKFRIQAALRDHVADDFRRHEVRADGDVGLKLGNEALERAGIEAVEHQAHSVRLPRLVRVAVDEAE